MKLREIDLDFITFPSELHNILSSAKLYDSSSSADAKVIYVDKGNGYFLKSSAKGTLAKEALMTNYYHKKGLSAKVIEYISLDSDWLLTEKIEGEDCVATKHLSDPKKLCDTLAERLAMLHSIEHDYCPIQNRTADYLKTVNENYHSGNYDKSHFPDSFGYTSADEAYKMVVAEGSFLQNDTLLHGDYCLPNIILNDWRFSGYIDVGDGGVGDRHIDIFWAIWSLSFNLKSDIYTERFFDAYGRKNINQDALRVVAAAEVFG